MAVESTQLLDTFAFNIMVNEFTVRADVLEKQGGKNSAPGPHEFLEVALAACTAITLQMYAKRKGIPLEYADVKIKITAEGASNEMLREIKLLGQLTEEDKKSLMIIAEKCPIHKFLTNGTKITSLLV
jgi:putative redox protein